jgi:hypothetical protein
VVAEGASTCTKNRLGLCSPTAPRHRLHSVGASHPLRRGRHQVCRAAPVGILNADSERSCLAKALSSALTDSLAALPRGWDRDRTSRLVWPELGFLPQLWMDTVKLQRECPGLSSDGWRRLPAPLQDFRQLHGLHWRCSWLFQVRLDTMSAMLALHNLAPGTHSCAVPLHVAESPCATAAEPPPAAPRVGPTDISVGLTRSGCTWPPLCRNAVRVG